jgi:hypothetical protein
VLANRGTHGGYGGDLGVLIRDTRKLCGRIREIRT